MFLRISRQVILLTYINRNTLKPNNMIIAISLKTKNLVETHPWLALEMGEWQLIIVKDTLKSSEIRIKNGTFPFFRANEW